MKTAIPRAPADNKLPPQKVLIRVPVGPMPKLRPLVTPKAEKPRKWILSLFNSKKPSPEGEAITKRLVQGAKERIETSRMLRESSAGEDTQKPTNEGKLPDNISEAFADALSREALRRIEISRKLKDSEPKQMEISIEEGNIICHMLNGEYEKAAKMARASGFKDLAEDAATGFVIEQMRKGNFASATKAAEEYGLNNHAAAAALSWAKAEASMTGFGDYVSSRFCAKEFAREFKGSPAFALWESLENIQVGLGDQLFAALIAKKYEKVSDESFEYRNILLANMKWETLMPLVHKCMQAGDFRTMRTLAEEFALPKRYLHAAAFRVAYLCIWAGDYKAADKIESFFNFNSGEMRRLVSDAMRENLDYEKWERVLKTAEHYSYVSGGFGFPAQKKQARYMAVESLMISGRYLAAARSAAGWGFKSLAEETAMDLAAAECMANRDYDKAESIAREFKFSQERLRHTARNAAAASINGGDYYTAALTCMRFGFKNELREAVKAMIAEYKERGYNGEVSAFYTAEQFGLKDLMKEAGAELSARDIAAGLYMRANSRNRKCGFTAEETRKIAANGVALNLGEPEGLSLWYAAKTVRKYGLTYDEVDLGVFNAALKYELNGRTEDANEITSWFNAFANKMSAAYVWEVPQRPLSHVGSR